MRTRRQFNLGIGAAWIVIGILYLRFHFENQEESWDNHDADQAGAQFVAEKDGKPPVKAHNAPTTIGTISVTSNTESIVPQPLSPVTVLALSSSSITSTPTEQLGSSSVIPTLASSQPTELSSALPDRIVVMGKVKDQDTTWVQEHLPDWQNAIYTVDDPNSTTLHTSVNKGREAVPYLTYLVDNYHSLPSTITFLHAHRNGYPEAWHNDAPGYDNVESLRTLNIDFIQKNGYANLRCLGDPGCPGEVQPFRDPPEAHRTIEAAMPDAWQDLFNNTNVPQIMATPCCGQFAVSKNQVLKRPLEDYRKYLDWLLHTTLKDETSGRVFEYLWHIIFGQEPVYCPALEKCYCDVYGRC